MGAHSFIWFCHVAAHFSLKSYIKVLSHVVEDVSLKNDLLPSDNGVRQVETDKEWAECFELKTYKGTGML